MRNNVSKHAKRRGDTRRGAALTLTLLLLCLAASSTTAQTRHAQSIDATQLMPAEHAVWLQKWLQTKPGLRLATSADCQNKQGLRSMRQSFGKQFQPDYLTTDFNHDAVNDFAVALIDPRRKADAQFTLVIFHGQGNSSANSTELNDGGAFKAAFTQAGLDLRQGGLWAGALVAGRTPLYVGVFETDDCTYLKWNGKRYVLQPCEGN